MALELAGPGSQIYFDPSKVHCAIVTCGGLCPGTNDVHPGPRLELYHLLRGAAYTTGCATVFKVLSPSTATTWWTSPLRRWPTSTFSGARCCPPPGDPKTRVRLWTPWTASTSASCFSSAATAPSRAASEICKEIARRELRIGVIVIPKTIDNDIALVSRSFGFDTAVEVATEAIHAAHTEAVGSPNGIGLVKLMGRYSGFIAATACLALQGSQLCSDPEVDFDLDGENGLLANLEERLKQRRHALIVVAEGAGERYFTRRTGSVTPRAISSSEISGTFSRMRSKITSNDVNLEVNLKYIDPSYLIRSMPANYNDRIYCGFLGQNAVHAGMAGKTAMLVSRWHSHYVHIPIQAAVDRRKEVELDSPLWRSVIESTGQPPLKNL